LHVTEYDYNIFIIKIGNNLSNNSCKYVYAQRF